MVDVPKIPATRRQIRELADGTLEVKLHVHTAYKDLFHKLLPALDMMCTLEVLQRDFDYEEKLKG